MVFYTPLEVEVAQSLFFPCLFISKLYTFYHYCIAHLIIYIMTFRAYFISV